MMNVVFIMVSKDYPDNTIIYMLEINENELEKIKETDIEDYTSFVKATNINPFNGEEIVFGRDVNITVNAFINLFI